MKSITTQK